MFPFYVLLYRILFLYFVQWLYVFVGDAPIGFISLLHLPYPLRLN